MVSNDASSRKIKEDKYKILRMSLILGDGADKASVIEDFRESALEVDEMNQETYENGLRTRYYDTLTIEEEKKKLEDLVNYIGGRIEQREALVNDFLNVTGKELIGLDNVTDAYRLDDFKTRLMYIEEYLDNTANIDNINKEIVKINEELLKSKEEKQRLEDCNIVFEDKLVKSFEEIIDSKYKSYDGVSINQELLEVSSLVNDSKKNLDVFSKAFNSLKQAGLSGREEREYSGYVNNAAKTYYDNKELEFLLRIYACLREKYQDYGQLVEKREKIQGIIKERVSLRESLKIGIEDSLKNFVKLFNSQHEEIKAQSDIIETISKLEKDLEVNKGILLKYEDANQKVEILSILREFCVINDESEYSDVRNDEASIDSDDNNYVTDFSFDSNYVVDNSYESDLSDGNYKSEVSNEDIIVSTGDVSLKREVDLEPVVEQFKADSLDPVFSTREYKDNEIVKIEEAIGFDLDKINNKANSVMLKVGSMLGISLENEVSSSNIPSRGDGISPVETVEVGVREETIPSVVATDTSIGDSNQSDVFNGMPDLPTVSSLTSNGSISSNTDVVQDFWGSDANDSFDFPDINQWGGN